MSKKIWEAGKDLCRKRQSGMACLSVCSGAKLNCREIQKDGCEIEKQSCKREMEKSI
jgi:hypothetical protein